jgi:hypothetical protein
MFFTFPEDATWNADRQAVEFGVGVGEYGGIVRVGPARLSAATRTARLPSGAWRATISIGHGSR